jgi:hypothetical protein
MALEAREGEKERKMARIKKGSKHIILLIAFMSVVLVAGGLLGAIGGAVCILLFRSMFNMSTGITEFIVATVLLGAGLAFVLGVMLTVQRPLAIFTRPRTTRTMGAISPVIQVTTTDGQ